jgi:hypothetical protein
VSTHVPRGEGPFKDWTAAQVRAYQIDGLDKRANWTWERSCYEWELFNGFGYRAHGVHSPYLFAGTNIYARGKYDSDGHWDPADEDEQLGVIPVMARIAALRPDLALPFPFPTSTPAAATAPVPAVPMPPPIGVHDAAALQRALNALGAAPALDVDDNYGRETRRAVAAFQKSAGLDVDGLAGPATWSAITRRLAAAAPAASA